MSKYLPLFIFIILVICVNCSRKNTHEKVDVDQKCLIKHDPGPCRMAINRYYYDQMEKKCKKFIYGGCKGSVPFETLKECQVACGCLPVSPKE